MAVTGVGEPRPYQSIVGARLVHGLVEYHRLAPDKRLRVALSKMAMAALTTLESRAILETGELHSGNFYWQVLAFAALHADEPDRTTVREFLTRWLSGPGARAARQIVSVNPDHWTGDTAFVHTNLPETLFWLNVLPVVSAAADVIPPPTPEAADALARIERDGRRRGTAETSWQDEYDRPEFKDYLGKWLP